MGQNLFTVLFSTIKSRFASLVSKIRLWTSWNYIRTRLTGLIRDFFYKLLDVRPKHKNDYYTIFGWMVSKRLAYFVIIMIGVLSIWYISVTTKIFSSIGVTGGLRTYDYNSVLLRLADNKVRIRGKSKYIAYEGEVSKGYVTGEGTLFSPDEVVLYNGTFEKNKFEGAGTQYYDTGMLHYNGNFHENLYEGIGTLYREDGTEEYEGDFFQGMKEGHGKLFDGGNNELYEGSFAADNIVFSELLGKDTSEIREMYFGDMTLYEATPDLGGDSALLLEGINVICHEVSDGGAADDTPKTQTVYVLSDEFRTGVTKANDISDLGALMGAPVYEGNSNIIFPEVIAVNNLNVRKYAVNGKVNMDTTEEFSDFITVNSFDEGYVLYVYTFRRGDLMYSFYSSEAGENFDFYSVTTADGDEE